LFTEPLFFRYLNPENLHIILHDQRGAGQSKPYAEIRENTISHLVDDIEKLPRSTLIIRERAGHSASAEPLQTFLLNAVKTFE
jgi:pimeloyl-ACP methyl ester carboxylesterase